MKHGECPTNESLKDESGLSLIESMMAMLILLVGLLAMAQVLVFGVITSKTVGRDAGKTTASAYDKMEELTGLQFSDTTTNVAVAPPYPANGMGLVAGGSIYPSSPAAGYSDYLDKTGGRTTGTAAAYTRQWQIVNDSATVKRIIVTVTSNKGFKYGKAPSTILVAQKTPQREFWAGTQEMRCAIQTRSEDGFSLMEMIVAVLVLLPVMGAAISLFSVGTNQQASEQSSIDANQEAHAALEMMAAEIAQAGSHGDKNTVTTAAINGPSSNPQSVTVASTAALNAGDWVDVGTGANWESVKLTAVTTSQITGIFRIAHASGTVIRLFALPYVTGVVPPTGMGVSSSSTVTTLKFFGDIYSDSNLYYVEYTYDSANAQITRSITPVTQTTKNAAITFVRNLVAGSVQFTVNTDSLGVITSVNVAMTVRNNWKTGSNYQQTQLSTGVLIPSTLAGSVLKNELLIYGGVNKLPPTPSQVTGWI